MITAALAETAADAIAMAFGGFLSARTYERHHASEAEAQEVREVPTGFGLSDMEAELIVAALWRDENRWVELMMRFELGLEKPDPRRALKSAPTIAGSYAVGHG